MAQEVHASDSRQEAVVRPPCDAPEISPREMRRIGIASFTGSVIEFYDFSIYGTAAALVFPHIFFPALGTAAGTLASFATFGVAFIARPVGSIVFGHFGDRLGRKKTLVATLLIMGLSTVLIGALPTAEQIGIVAPLLLVLLRFLQGLAAGGEYAGGALLASENAPKARRGFWAMLPLLAGGIAYMTAPATFLTTSFGMSSEDFLSYGWRIPFLASALILLVGMYIRLRMDETPVFKKEAARSESASLPLLEAFKHQRREIMFASGAVVGSFAILYIGSTYLTSYGTAVLNLSRTSVIAVGVTAGAALTLGVYLGAVWSDRGGRRRVLLCASAAGAAWSLVLFPLLNLGSTAAFCIGVAVSALISGVGFGPVGALMSELFHTRYRYTATALSYSIAGVIGGAVPPLIAAAIAEAYGSFAVGVALAGFCVISFLSCLALKETRDYELDRSETDA
ncbi:MFS transporter [Rhodococcus koreensis]|uniref:MFS transporter n=1 Tax=Rhodococcus koreensis TaxID=99653 RepID=UPI0036716612